MQDGHRSIVVVVDDDEAVRESLRFLLDVAGYDADLRVRAGLSRPHCRSAGHLRCRPPAWW